MPRASGIQIFLVAEMSGIEVEVIAQIGKFSSMVVIFTHSVKNWPTQR